MFDGRIRTRFWLFQSPIAASAIRADMSKMDVEAARALAIAEALRASGARSLTELLDDHERHKEHLDRLCAKLEALPKVIKKKTRR